MFILPPEKRVAEVQLRDYAAEAPDIDFAVVGHAEDYFGGAVVAALDVGVDGFPLEAAWTEIDDLDSRFVHLLQKNVLRFEVRVNNPVTMQEVDSIQQLQHEASDQIERQPVVPVGFDQLVEVER